MSSDQSPEETSQGRGTKRPFPPSKTTGEDEMPGRPAAAIIAPRGEGTYPGIQHTLIQPPPLQPPQQHGPRGPLYASGLYQHSHSAARSAESTKIPLRTGQWTTEEIAFANKVIEYFDMGSLPNCKNGTTLRALLADTLHCSPMRISKKFAGDGAIGKRTFTKQSSINQHEIDSLRALEYNFHESIQGRARWPLVEWNTLLLGKNTTGPAASTTGSIDRETSPRPNLAQPLPSSTTRHTASTRSPGTMPLGTEHNRPLTGPHRTSHHPSGLQPISRTHHQAPPTRSVHHRQQQPVLGAPGPRAPWLMSPPPVPAPPREGREVRHTLSKLKQHCAPITLERLAADHAAALPDNTQHRQEPITSTEAAETHNEVYGWVPSELGVPDTDPAALARILDAERDARPYTDDIARQSHLHHIQPLQAPIIYVPPDFEQTQSTAVHHRLNIPYGHDDSTIRQRRREQQLFVPSDWEPVDANAAGHPAGLGLTGHDTEFPDDDLAYDDLPAMRRGGDISDSPQRQPQQHPPAPDGGEGEGGPSQR